MSAKDKKSVYQKSNVDFLLEVIRIFLIKDF